MKASESSSQSVRQMLAERTRQAHEALHVHPWIASLVNPELTIDRYAMVLGAYHGIYEHVSDICSKHELPASLSLIPARDRLKHDLDFLNINYQNETKIPVELTVDDPVELLGALYVLHGSSFGATILNRNVRRVLPDAPRHFLETGTIRKSWQHLILELEHYNCDDLAREKLFHGANATFYAFGSHVTRHCESRSSMFKNTGTR